MSEHGLINFIFYMYSHLDSFIQSDFVSKTTIDWNLCEGYILTMSLKTKEKIGNLNQIVEIDKTFKKNSGRILPQQWIFGDIC